MIEARTITVSDPFVEANVMHALAGAGAPSGVIVCIANDGRIEVQFDPRRTVPELIDALIEVALRFVPGAPATEPLNAEQVVAVAAAGLHEPRLDRTRIIESHLA